MKRNGLLALIAAVSSLFAIPAANASTLEDFYAAVRIEDLVTDRTVYTVGQTVTPSYRLYNRGSELLDVPLTDYFGTQFRVIGTAQHWVLRLGSDPTIPSIPPFVAGSGGRYAAGGEIIVTSSTLPSHQWPVGVGIPRSAAPIDTTGFPNGRYRFFVEYKRLFENVVLRTETVDFEVAGGVEDRSPATIELEPQTAVGPVGGGHCVTATVRDASGRPAASIGVQFGASLYGGGINLGTGSDGRVMWCFPGFTPGVDTITARVDGSNLIATATKTWLPLEPATVTLGPAAAARTAGEEHCVQATAQAENGADLASILLRFSVTGANTASGEATTRFEFSGTRARFCYTGKIAGQDTITVVAQGGTNPRSSATATWSAGPASAISLAPDFATGEVAHEACTTATVTDRFGNAVSAAAQPGTVVNFRVNGTNGDLFSSQEPDADGHARMCYTGYRSGDDRIIATIGGVIEAVAVRTWLPGPLASFGIETPVPEGAVDNPLCVLAIAQDAFGNAVPDVAVEFAASRPVDPHGGTARTTAFGYAEFCVVTPLHGEVVVTALATDNPQMRSEATLAFVPPASTCGSIKGRGSFSNRRSSRFVYDVNLRADESQPRGRVSFKDADAGIDFSSSHVDAVVIDPDAGGSIFGHGLLEGRSVRFRIDVSFDMFRIRFSEGHVTEGVVARAAKVKLSGCRDRPADEEEDDDD